MGDYVPVGTEHVIRFAPSQKLPDGWWVVQLDSGHYMATDGETDSAITVNRYHARRWALQLAEEQNRG